jgi:Cof subfamily protein (haloacid dehalogenase superfamily)
MFLGFLGNRMSPPPVLEIKEIFCYDNYGYRVQAGSDDMIKVIASDMDGTLLNSEHTISKRTYDIIQKVQRAGIRFMIATGRDFPSASDTLKRFPLCCDWVTGSGAEIRNEAGELLQTIPMDPSCFGEIVSCVRQFPASIRFCTTGRDLVLTESEDLEGQILEESRLFFGGSRDEEIRATEQFQQLMRRMNRVKSLEELLEKKIPIYKVFITAKTGEVIQDIWKEVERIPGLAVASSFFNNLELTDEEAQKGPAILRYIESLGYKKEDVMVLGDSLNDLSMFRAGFGAAVAMANAHEQIREASGFLTKSNDEDGAAYAMELVLEGKLDLLKKEGIK